MVFLLQYTLTCVHLANCTYKYGFVIVDYHLSIWTDTIMVYGYNEYLYQIVNIILFQDQCSDLMTSTVILRSS